MNSRSEACFWAAFSGSQVDLRRPRPSPWIFSPTLLEELNLAKVRADNFCAAAKWRPPKEHGKAHLGGHRGARFHSDAHLYGPPVVHGLLPRAPQCASEHLFTSSLPPASKAPYDPGRSSAAVWLHAHRVARDGGDHCDPRRTPARRVLAGKSEGPQHHVHGESAAAGVGMENGGGERWRQAE